MYIRLIIAIIVFTFCGVWAHGQDTAPDVPPKVGLVLSGGGAKGLAHIGALKVIEESGIKVDYIGGTSMGAIVGALYASGYSAHELDSIFKKTDFIPWKLESLINYLTTMKQCPGILLDASSF